MFVEMIERIVRSPFEVPRFKPVNGVILASFPKSGNTWLRFMTSNILSLATSEIEVNFHSLAKYAPVIRGNVNLNEIIESDSYPTFLKTHFYNVSGFNDYKSVLLYRNPEKCLWSYYNYMMSEHGKTYKNYSSFLKSSRVGIDAWLLFHRTWLESDSVIVISYDELINNQYSGIKEIYNKLGFSIQDNYIHKSIVNSSRENMARLEYSFGDPNKKNKQYNFVGLKEDRHNKVQKERSIDDFVMSQCKVVYDKLEVRKIVI